jgi:hypothetical protein
MVEGFDRITQRLEERLSGIAAANRGGQEAVIARAEDALIGVLPDLAARMETNLRLLWRWSWESATKAIIRVLPLRFWVARHVQIKTLVTEAREAGSFSGPSVPCPTLRTGFSSPPPGRFSEAEDFEFGPDAEIEKILRGEVTDAEAREIVRRIEFPSPTPEKVTEIIDRTEAFDNLSAMQRIRTVETYRLPELRELLIGGYSRGPNGQIGMAWLMPRLKELVGGVNYRAKRIARTEGVRVAEAGLREAWENCQDLMDGVQWFSAQVPDSRPDHVARHGKVYRRTSGGWIADDGESLPPIPLGPNCLCWTSPVLAADITDLLPDADYGTYDAAKARFKQEKRAASKPPG